MLGNEPREKFDFKHKNLKIYPWLPHIKILDLYKKSSISVVPSRWEEPFGRTAIGLLHMGVQQSHLKRAVN